MLCYSTVAHGHSFTSRSSIWSVRRSLKTASSCLRNSKVPLQFIVSWTKIIWLFLVKKKKRKKGKRIVASQLYCLSLLPMFRNFPLYIFSIPIPLSLIRIITERRNCRRLRAVFGNWFVDKYALKAAPCLELNIWCDSVGIWRHEPARVSSTYISVVNFNLLTSLLPGNDVSIWIFYIYIYVCEGKCKEYKRDG